METICGSLPGSLRKVHFKKTTLVLVWPVDRVSAEPTVGLGGSPGFTVRGIAHNALCRPRDPSSVTRGELICARSPSRFTALYYFATC